MIGELTHSLPRGGIDYVTTTAGDTDHIQLQFKPRVVEPVSNHQLFVFLARIISEPGAKRLYARAKNTMGTKRRLPSVQSLRSWFLYPGT